MSTLPKEFGVNQVYISSCEMLGNFGFFKKLAILNIKTPNIQLYFKNSLECKEAENKYVANDTKTCKYKVSSSEFVPFYLPEVCSEFQKLTTSTSFEEICELILSSGEIDIQSKNIPQFSNFSDGNYTLIKDLYSSGNYGPSFCKIGVYLLGNRRSKVAFTKYGENHSKLAELLDLTYITNESPRRVFLSQLGFLLLESDEEFITKLIRCQILKIPIIKKIIKDKIPSSSYLDFLCQFLSRSTATRRLPNIKTLLHIFQSSNNSFIDRC